MKMNKLQGAGCRELSEQEAQLVAGGEEEIVVTGYRENNLYLLDMMSSGGYGGYSSYDGGSYFGGGGGGGGGYVAPNSDADGDGQPDPDIVVTGTPMTDQQKAAYDMSYDRAWWDLAIVSALGMGGLALLGRGGGFVGAGGGAVLGLMDETQAIQTVAEHYYHLDGLDGVYDGFNELDMQSYGIERYPGY